MDLRPIFFGGCWEGEVFWVMKFVAVGNDRICEASLVGIGSRQAFEQAVELGEGEKHPGFPQTKRLLEILFLVVDYG